MAQESEVLTPDFRRAALSDALVRSGNTLVRLGDALAAGPGGGAALPVGTGPGTVAAGDDARIMAAQNAAQVSSLANASAAAAVAAEAAQRAATDATLAGGVAANTAALATKAPLASPPFTNNIGLSGAAAGAASVNIDVPGASSPQPLARFNHQGLAGSPSNAQFDGLNYPFGFSFDQTRIAADQLSAAADMGNRSGALGQSVVHLYGGGAATGTRIAQAAFSIMQAPMAAADPSTSFFGAHWGFAIASVNNGGTAGASKGNLFGYNPQVQLKTGATYWGTLMGMECDVEAQTGASVAYKYGVNITTIGSDAVHASVREAALHIGAVPGTSGWTMGIQFSDFSGGGLPVSAAGTLIGSAGNVGSVAHGVDLRGFTFTGYAFASLNFAVDGTGFASARGAKVSANAAALPTPAAGTLLQLGAADGATARFTLDAFGGATSISARRANGTAAAPSALASGDLIGQLVAFGFGATGYSGARANVNLFAGGAWSDTSQPAYVLISTTPVGSTTQAERLRVQPSGAVTIGSAADDGLNLLQVAGPIAQNGRSLTTVLVRAGAPTTSDIPASTAAVVKDTTAGTVKLFFNDGGTLKSVALA